MFFRVSHFPIFILFADKMSCRSEATFLFQQNSKITKHQGAKTAWISITRVIVTNLFKDKWRPFSVVEVHFIFASWWTTAHVSSQGSVAPDIACTRAFLLYTFKICGMLSETRMVTVGIATSLVLDQWWSDIHSRSENIATLLLTIKACYYRIPFVYRSTNHLRLVDHRLPLRSRTKSLWNGERFQEDCHWPCHESVVLPLDSCLLCDRSWSDGNHMFSETTMAIDICDFHCSFLWPLNVHGSSSSLLIQEACRYCSFKVVKNFCCGGISIPFYVALHAGAATFRSLRYNVVRHDCPVSKEGTVSLSLS